MKVLHVADFIPSLHSRAGGAEFVAQRLVDEQVREGIEVELATLKPDLDPTDGHLPNHVMRNLDGYAPRLAYAVKQLFLPWDPLAGGDLSAAIERSQPDIVHYHNLHFTGLSVVDKARAAGVPSVWSVYDYWIFCPSFMLLTSQGELCTSGHGARCVDCIGARRLPWLRGLKRAMFSNRAANFQGPKDAVDSFVVLSDASRDLLTHHGICAERIRVVPQYIWPEAAESDHSSIVPGRLIYVGWIDSRKGLHVVIEALARVADTHPEVHLDVLGLPASDEYEQQVRQRVDDLGIADRVNFKGKLSRGDLLGELQSANLVTIPEQWENMSPVILTEAMAAGACVLASRVGGIKHFVQEGNSGLLAERDDPDDFARQIRWAMDHQDSVREMGRAARLRAREVFDPQRINNEMRDLYNQLIERYKAA